MAILNREKHPAAAKVIEEDIYVDDLMTGADSIQELIELKVNIAAILQSAQFNMRKWSSNNEKIRRSICEINVPASNLKIAENPEATKLLGLEWNPKPDEFYFFD